MQEKQIGRDIEAYHIVKKLGNNNFTTVYLGEERNSRGLVALKMQDIAYDNMPRNFHDFLGSRARTLARLSHPNVIRLISFGEQGDVEYFAMQYASLGSVRQKYPPGSRMAIHTLANYVNQIVDALQFAHSQQITHSYLKPENILLEAGEHILLSDFGPSENLYLSQVMNTQISLSSYSYIAPEQLQGNVQAASDQYALGGIIYEWICGHPPFIGSAKEVLTQHLEREPPPLSEMVPGISPLIEEVIMLALAKDPEDRFASITAFAVAFNQAALAQE